MKPPAECKQRISVTAVYMAVQSVVEVIGTTAVFFGRGWSEGLRINNLPAGVEFGVVGDGVVDLGRSDKGVWRANNSSVSEQARRRTHTTLMSLVIPPPVREPLINLSTYGKIELVFSAVLVPSTLVVNQIVFLPLLSGELTPLFTSHNAAALTRERVVELSKADPYSLPAKSVKRHYVYPAANAARAYVTE